MSIKTAIAQRWSVLAATIVKAAASVGAAAGGIGALRYVPKTDPDARRGSRRRRAARSTRAVDRVVIDQWLMWRH